MGLMDFDSVTRRPGPEDPQTMDTSMDDQVLFDEWVDFEQADLSHHPKPMPGNPLSACPPGRSFTNPIPSAGQELTPGLRFPYDSFADPSHLSMVTTDPVVDQDFISPAVTHQPLTRVGAQNQFEVEDLERLIQLTAGNKEPTIPGLTVDGSSAGGNSPTLRALPLVESTGTATANNIAEARRHDDVWTTPRITDVPVDHMMIDAEDRHHHHHPYGAGGVVPDGKQTSVIGHDFPLMTFPAGVIDVDGSGAIFGGDLHASPQNQQTSFSWEEVAQQSYPQMPLQAIGPVSSPLSPPETPPPPVESRPKQTRRVHDPEETKEIRNEGACSHCSILKQKCSLRNPCERCVKIFGERAGRVCTRRDLPAFGKLADQELHQLLANMARITKPRPFIRSAVKLYRSVDVDVLLHASGQAPMSKMTLSTVQWDDGRREEMLLPENSPGPDLLESLAETLYPWNGWHEGAGNPDFKFHDIVKLLGKTLKDKSSLIHNCHRVSCFFALLSSNMYYRPLSNPLMVQPLPSAIVNSIRKTTVSALEKAHRDALDEVERLARSSNNKPGIEVWLSLWLLIFLYRDLLALGEGEMASVTTAAISQHQQHQHQQQVQRERAMWPHQLQTGQHVAPVGQNTWATLSSGSTPLLPLSPYPSPPAGFHQRLQPVQQQQQQPQQPQHSQQPQQRSIPATQTPQAASLTQHTRRLYEATVVLYRAIFRSRNMINSVAGPEALTKLGESSPLVLSIFDKAKEAKARFFRLERQNYPMEPFMHDMIVDHEHRVENRRPTQAKGSAAAASATGRPRMNRGGRAGAGGSAWIGNGSPPH